MKKILAIVLITAFSFQLNLAQKIDERLRVFPKEMAKGYIQPLVDIMGANLNSGLYHTASTSKLFGFYVGVKAILGFVPSSAKTFTADFGSDYSPSQVETATVLGDKDGGKTVRFKNAIEIKLPGGLGLKAVPLLIPQVSVSTANTEILIRYLPAIQISKDMGSINLVGIGLAHSISQYIPLFPIDLAVQGVYQRFKVGGYFEATALNFNIHASKSFLLLTIYAGVGYETFSTKINYTYTVPGSDISQQFTLELKGQNNFRITAGIKLGLGFFDINADYSIGKFNVASAGIGFSF